MDAQLVAVGGLLSGNGVVQVFGVGAVDGEDGPVPQVQAGVDVGLGDGHLGNLLGLLHDFRGEGGGDAAALDNGVGADTGAAAAAKDSLHLALGPVAPGVHFWGDEDFVAVFGAAGFAGEDQKVETDGAVWGDGGALGA